MEYVCLLDCNNFFVSCERLFRPDLLQRPTVVLSSNDGCVVARSQEIKDLGIPMGVPLFKVRDELKKVDAAIFSSNFRLYRDISRRVMEVLKAEVGQVEQYSVDEAFFRLNLPESDIENSLVEIKRVVEKQVGIPVSVGAAKTKTIAKCASEKAKKRDGVCLLVGDEWRSYAKEVGIGQVWGIGRKTAEKCSKNNINTAFDLVNSDRARVSDLFGVVGIRLQSELSEEPVSKVSDELGLQHSIMSTRSFSKSSSDIDVLKDAVSYHVAHAAEELREQNALAQSLKVLIRPSRHNDWFARGGTLEVLLNEPTDDTRVLVHEAMKLTERLFENEVPYKKAGVILSLISNKDFRSGNLFETEITKDDGEIMKALDEVNKRFGRNTLKIGRLGKETNWQTSSEYVSSQYTTAWNQIAKVKA